MSNKLSVDASGDSGATPIEREVFPLPPHFDPLSKSCSGKDIDGWEVLSQHSPTKNPNDDGEDKKSDQSKSPVGFSNGSKRWPGRWLPLMPHVCRDLICDLESSAVGKDMSKSEDQPSQPNAEACDANKENNNQNTSVAPDLSHNLDSEVNTIVDDSLIMQPSSEEPGSESLFWVSGHVDMLVAERRELFTRIEKLEGLVKTQAVAVERIDNLQNQIDQIQEARATAKKANKKRNSARKQEKQELEDILEQVEEDIDYLSQDVDYVLDDFGALQDTVMDLTDESTSLNAKVTELTERFEQYGRMNNANGGFGGSWGSWVEQGKGEPWTGYLPPLSSQPENTWGGTSWTPSNN
ncbi:hypothetical protein M434DRAFT_96093 [Hypoxylon sp. CO27-5]|nr:hypothetical protein M434DRAFT_96093 [Hypoxylon sp. CO27-5]